MKLLLLSAQAEADIAAVWDYSAETWGNDQAYRYTANIRDACHAIAAGTKRGQRTAIRPDYRKLPVGSHIVYFRDLPERIEIVRVLHRRQDTDRHL